MVSREDDELEDDDDELEEEEELEEDGIVHLKRLIGRGMQTTENNESMAHVASPVMQLRTESRLNKRSDCEHSSNLLMPGFSILEE